MHKQHDVMQLQLDLCVEASVPHCSLQFLTDLAIPPRFLVEDWP